MNFHTRPHLWLGSLLTSAFLVACGGGNDDDTPPVEPLPTPTNVAECHNPSMYKLGSSWTVTSSISGDVEDSPALLPNYTAAGIFYLRDGVATTYVTAPPLAWGLPEGTVKLSTSPASSDSDIKVENGYAVRNVGGTYVRVNEGTLDTLLTATWAQFSRSFPDVTYRVYGPNLSEPLNLSPGETYSSPIIRYVESEGAFYDVEMVRVAPPPLYGGAASDGQELIYSFTFVGGEVITVPAGTFSTCHTRRSLDGFIKDEWRVADGPYKGITVRAREQKDHRQATWVASAIEVDWK